MLLLKKAAEMGHKVVYGFWPTEAKAKQAIKKLPSIFKNPRVEPAGGDFAAVVGEYDNREIANQAIHKLFECGLHGGIWIV